MKILWQNEKALSIGFIGIYSILILIMPYFRGLFFEENFYFFELGLGILFITVLLTYYRSKTTQVFTSITLYPLLFFTVIYYISSLQRITPQAAFDDFLRQLIYFIVFVGLVVLLDKNTTKWVLHAIFVSVIWISVYGLFALFGWVNFTDAVETWSNRISSVLQYPNTLAAVVGATIIGILMYSVRNDVKWHIRGLYLSQLVPLLIVFIYTQSRATYLMLPLVWFIALLFLSVRQQFRFILSTLLLFGTIIPLILNFDQYIAEQYDLIIPIIFVIGFVYGLISLGASFLLGRIKNKKEFHTPYLRLIIPISLIFIVVIGFVLLQSTSLITLLPETIQTRISTISLEDIGFSSRATFVADSFELLKDHWIIGAGGKGWNNLYYSYQSYPYTSTQTHSSIMKILTDVGVLGFIFFILFICLLIFQIYRWIRKYGVQNERLVGIGIPFIVAFMIFLHSLVDFDLSYGYVSIVLFSLWALVFIETREEATDLKIKSKGVAQAIAWSLIIPSLIFMIFIGRYAYASAINISGISYDEALKKVDKQITLSPSNINYHMKKMEILDVLVQSTADDTYKQELVQEALIVSELDKNNPISLIQTGQFFAKAGYGIDAARVSQQALELAPMLQVAYDQYITFSSQLSLLYLRENNNEEAVKNLQGVKRWLDQLEENIEYITTLPIGMQYPGLIITDPIRVNGGIALILTGEYDRAKTYVEPLMGNEDLGKRLNAVLLNSIIEENIGNTTRATELIESGRELDPYFDQKREEFLGFPRLDVK